MKEYLAADKSAAPSPVRVDIDERTKRALESLGYVAGDDGDGH